MTTDIQVHDRQAEIERSLAKAKNEALATLVSHTSKAINALTELVDMADSEAVRLQAAIKLLALVGITEVKESKSTNVNIDATVDADAKALLDRLAKNHEKRVAPPVVETTATEV